jgi:hypothetical protein
MPEMSCWTVVPQHSSQEEQIVRDMLDQHGVEFDDELPVGRETTAEEFAAVVVRSSARYRAEGHVFVQGGWTSWIVVVTCVGPGYGRLGNGEQPAAVAMVSRRSEPTRFLAVGCEHEWEGRRVGDCSYIYTCGCGCSYEVDSSG